MKFYGKTQYHDSFAAMVKITLRDGDATEREIVFLEHLMQKLSLTEKEYEFIMQNYLKYPITAPFKKEERIYAQYQLGKILNSDSAIEDEDKNRWLGRVAKSIGFEPNFVEDIISKALFLTKKEIEFQQFETTMNAFIDNL